MMRCLTMTFAAAFAVMLASPALAKEQACVMTYEKFEFAVPHLDLEECPASMAGEARFCRVSAASDALHVFAFEEEGEQCLITVETFNKDAFELSITAE